MEEAQPRPPAYWASPSRGMRHGAHTMGLPPPPQVVFSFLYFFSLHSLHFARC